jgi:hypothetical protein
MNDFSNYFDDTNAADFSENERKILNSNLKFVLETALATDLPAKDIKAVAEAVLRTYQSYAYLKWKVARPENVDPDFDVLFTPQILAEINAELGYQYCQQAEALHLVNIHLPERLSLAGLVPKSRWPNFQVQPDTNDILTVARLNAVKEKARLNVVKERSSE